MAGTLDGRATVGTPWGPGPLSRRHNARASGAAHAPWLVAASGFGTDQSAWNSLRPWMETRWRVLSFDLAGASPLLQDGVDPAEYRCLSGHADDLLALLDELDITGCDYLGHSVAGMVGALASIEDPARFARLALINASPRYLDEPESGYLGGFTEAGLAAMQAQMRDRYAQWVETFAPAVVAVPDPDALQHFSDGLLAMRPDVASAVMGAIFRSDLRGILAAIDVPTLLIHSRRDMAVPAGVGDYLAAHIAGSRLAWIDNDGHLPHLTAPEAIWNALEAWR